MKQVPAQNAVSDEVRRVLAGHHHDPFAVLGCHRLGGQWHIRALLPGAAQAEVIIGERNMPMERLPDTDFFSLVTEQKTQPDYQLRWRSGQGEWRQAHDPYRFGPTIGDLDLHLFGEGNHEHIYRILGAHCCEREGVSGVRFATWAPNAQRVSVVGDFNQWHGLSHTMRSRGTSGVWEIFIPGLAAGEHYKFELRDARGKLCLKADPYGNRFEMRPATAAVVCPPTEFQWGDQHWLEPVSYTHLTLPTNIIRQLVGHIPEIQEMPVPVSPPRAGVKLINRHR